MKIFVAEITAAIDAAGTTQTFYVTNGDGFTTRPTDTPANTPIRPALLNPGSYRREMFSGNRTFGAVRPAFGEAVLSNSEGVFDAWRAYGFDGRAFTLRWGEQGSTYPSEFTTVFVATMEGAVMDFREVRLRLRDNLQLLEKPVLNATFAGTGGIEGPSALAGEPKQRLLGNVGYPPPQLIDATARTYLISSGRSGMPEVWDNGIPLSGGSAASISDLLATPPAEGEFRFYGAGPAVMRLASNPAGDLRIQSTGTQSNGAPWNLSAFVAEAGFRGSVSGTLDPVGHLVESTDTTYLDILEQSAARLGKFFGFNRLGVLEAKDFAVPNGTPLHTFTRQAALSLTRSPPDGAPVPAYKVSMNFGRTWPSQLAGGAITAVRNAFSRPTWYASFSHEDASIRIKHPAAEAISLDSPASFGAGFWASLRDKYVAWYFTERDQVTVTSLLTAETLALDIGDVVEVKMARFGYDTGKLFRIVAVRYDLKVGRVEHVLWG